MKCKNLHSHQLKFNEKVLVPFGTRTRILHFYTIIIYKWKNFYFANFRRRGVPRSSVNFLSTKTIEKLATPNHKKFLLRKNFLDLSLLILGQSSRRQNRRARHERPSTVVHIRNGEDFIRVPIEQTVLRTVPRITTANQNFLSPDFGVLQKPLRK